MSSTNFRSILIFARCVVGTCTKWVSLNGIVCTMPPVLSTQYKYQRYHAECGGVPVFFFSSRYYFPAPGKAVVTGVVPSFPWFSPSIFIAHRVKQSHCSLIFHRVLLSHALALSASQLVHKKKSQRIYTSIHSAGLELTKLTYTRLEVNRIRHRGDRQYST